MFFHLYTVAAISFSQAIYGINEDTKFVQPVLVLSKLLLTDITVIVSTTDINATGNSYKHIGDLRRHMNLLF